MTNEPTFHRVSKSINRPLTIWGAERRLFFLATIMGAATFNFEVLGLRWKHLDFKAGTIKIEQRVWRQDVGRPKSEDSRRTLGLGGLIDRYRAFTVSKADEFVFQQKRAPGRPLWDSGVRDALHKAAEAED